MHVHNLPVLNYHSAGGFAGNLSIGPLWQSASVGATVSFDVVWNTPVTRRVNVQDTTQGFTGTFLEDFATVTWSASSTGGFRFTSNPGNFMTSQQLAPGNYFAQLAQERNGIFFPAGSTDGAGGHGRSAQAGMPTAGNANQSALPAATVLDGAGFVRAPSDSAPTAGSMSLPRQGGDALTATAAGKDQRVPFASVPHRVASRAALDHVFADHDANAFADALGPDEVPAWGG
jgi:hypothetical protein